MKLILSSKGFTTDEMADKVSIVVGKPLNEINIAIINETYVAIPETHSKRWIINELNNINKYIGGIIEFVNLRAYNVQEIIRRLKCFDLIYLAGGYQLVYSNLFDEIGLTEEFKKLSQEKTIMGASAGSMFLGKRIDSHKYWKDSYSLEYSELKNKELELVNFTISPHYLTGNKDRHSKEFLADCLKDNSFPVYAVQDSQAISYIDGKISFIGGNPEVFGRIKNS